MRSLISTVLIGDYDVTAMLIANANGQGQYQRGFMSIFTVQMRLYGEDADLAGHPCIAAKPAKMRSRGHLRTFVHDSRLLRPTSGRMPVALESPLWVEAV
jgi:hypothetical protein